MPQPLPLTDDMLLEKLRSGSEEAFTEIYSRYWERLFYLAHQRLKSAEDAKEVLQDIFLTIWQKRASLEIQSLPLYLAAMTRYAVYRHLASMRKKAAVPLDTSYESALSSKSFDIDNKQFLEILVGLSSKLPERHRFVFIHHKMLDYPLQDVADQLGVSVRTAEAYSAKVMTFMRRHRQELAIPLFFFVF